MLEYAFEEISVRKGFFGGSAFEHREEILRRAAEGWRYCGWVPTEQVNGTVFSVDLIFAREKGGSYEAGTD